MIIESKRYAETRTALLARPSIYHLYWSSGIDAKPLDFFAHEDYTPRFEFMMAANDQFAQVDPGYDGPLHIGAVAEVLISFWKDQREGEQWRIDHADEIAEMKAAIAAEKENDR